MAPHVSVGATRDGTLTYRIDTAPGDLPPVLVRDLLHAWEHAPRRCPPRRLVRRPRVSLRSAQTGTTTDLALQDEDARCWAGAVDRSLGMQTFYGISVCLRLLALVDLIAQAAWAAAMVDFEADGADLHPALVRAVAEARLTSEARFDEPMLRASLRTLPGTPPARTSLP